VISYLCEHAWLGFGSCESDVLVQVRDDRIVSVRPDAAGHPDAAGAVQLRGITVPGLANAHSHAFHRALRGHTQTGRGTFWTWREQMYRVAERLDPDTLFALARATYAEMVLAGITSVGEFHYLHHGPAGRRYNDPNVLGHTMVDAARSVGLRITLLDTCYLAGGVGDELAGPQLRFGDGDATAWAARADALADVYTGASDVVVGAAVHSVRAVPADQVPVVVGWAAGRGAPLHAHVSEQTAENDACLAAYGRTPTQLLADAGALGPRFTAVHATHLSAQDVSALGSTGSCVCMCPSTERDLADGIGPARALASAGAALSLGSDSQAVVDLFEEARGVELDERLATRARGHFNAGELLLAATNHASLGWADAGRIAAGALADLVTVRLDSTRTAGAPASPEAVVFAATAADVTHVVAAGRVLVRDGDHQLIPDVGRELATAVAAARG
jgi:formiminoglutamate deiminase